MFENVIEMSMLYDFYGALLTDKQKSVMELFHEDDYTQSEVADQLGVSRQAVHDAVKNCEKALLAFEDKLGLVQKFRETKSALEKNNQILDGIIKASAEGDAGADITGADSIGSEIIRQLKEIQNKNKRLIEIF